MLDSGIRISSPSTSCVYIGGSNKRPARGFNFLSRLAVTKKFEVVGLMFCSLIPINTLNTSTSFHSFEFMLLCIRSNEGIKCVKPFAVCE